MWQLSCIMPKEHCDVMIEITWYLANTSGGLISSVLQAESIKKLFKDSGMEEPFKALT